MLSSTTTTTTHLAILLFLLTTHLIFGLEPTIALAYPIFVVLGGYYFHIYHLSARYGRKYTLFCLLVAAYLSATNDPFFQHACGHVLDIFFPRDKYDETPGSGFEHWWWHNGDDVLSSAYDVAFWTVVWVVGLAVAGVVGMVALILLEEEREKAKEKAQHGMIWDGKMWVSRADLAERERLEEEKEKERLREKQMPVVYACEIEELSHAFLRRNGMPVPGKMTAGPPLRFS